MASKSKKAASKSQKGTQKAAAAGSMYRTSTIYKAARAVPLAELPAEFSRADIEFIGVDHSGASYEARVFVNNANANGDTPMTDANGYAGSYYIFGHGGCFGDVGHCDVPQKQDAFDIRPSHALEPIRKVVIATEAIKQAAAQSADINVTVVPVIMSWTDKSDLNDVMKFDHINLITYD
ncbi:MAG: hypothetical protein QOE82_1276 [Thermoanaerobaculia bacterium]|jgi:tyrosinase|nr:hypothetical protein [Thermoanaerobaculia bacterium]